MYGRPAAVNFYGGSRPTLQNCEGGQCGSLQASAAVRDSARVARNPSPALPHGGRGHFGSMGSAEDGDGFHDFFHAEEVAVVRLDVDGVYVGLCAFVNFVLQALDVCVCHEFDFVEL